jgi:hypothetical protein
MISFKDLKDIVLLSESGTDDETIGKIFNINPKKIKKYYLKGKKILSRDVDEADASGGSPGTTAPAQPTVTKWESGLNRGRANPTDQNHKWESGLVRGRANRLA